ncbi:MAG: redoxin family protein [Bacteroidota bacterium]
MKTVCTFLFLMVTLPLAAQVQVGETAPNFTYDVLTGGSFSLLGQRGSVVYIFFFGAGCPHCRQNGPVTESQIYQEFRENENFIAIGIDTWNTSASTVNTFRNITGISYPLLLNGRQSLQDYYGNTTDYDRSVVVDADGNLAYRGTQFVNGDFQAVRSVIEQELAKVSVSNDEDPVLPSRVQLEQNYPNPFNPTTAITFSLPETERVQLTIFNILGEQVATLLNETVPAGDRTVTWNAVNNPSGIYFYQLRTANEVLTNKMMLIK